MKAVAIIQARCGSTRFPRKVLADLCGYPVLEHVLSRALAIKGIDEVCLAVPDEEASDELEAIAEVCEHKAQKAIRIVRGDELDVLDRYTLAARKCEADYIMRITSDCPLIDPQVCNQVLQAGMMFGIQYASNVHPRTFEKGLDCEVFTRFILERANKESVHPLEREHVTPWIYDNAVDFVNVDSGFPSRSNINWSVDTPEDLERVKLEYRRRYSDDD